MSDTHYPTFVPNEGDKDARLWVIGEAPGATEVAEQRPFIGESGNILTTCLARAGVSRNEVYLANLCNYRPFDNKFERLIGTDVLEQSIIKLHKDIIIHKPNVIISCGNYPLQYIGGYKGIRRWRGSILHTSIDNTVKLIPTVHPAAVLRDRSLYPIFDLDIKRAVSDSAFRDKRLPVRKFIIDPSGLEGEEWTQRLCQAKYLGCDIETVKNSSIILCMGFAPEPNLAVCFLWSSESGRSSIARILQSRAKKIFHFGIFDTTQLCTLNGLELTPDDTGRIYFWDTYAAQHVLQPELPRSLEYLTSVYTREPYYKTVGRGTIPDDEKGWSEKVEKQSLYEYNCKDCCCTIEIALEQMQEMSAEPQTTQAIFDFDMRQIGLQRHISDSGLLRDEERRALLERVLIDKWNKRQWILNGLVGVNCNVRSPKLKGILYGKNQLNLPEQRNRKGGVTTDEDAIVKLIGYCKNHLVGLSKPDAITSWQVRLAVCKLVLEIRGMRQVLSNYILETKKHRRAGSDGRVRSLFYLGPETGRWAASKYVDGSGFNAQTLPRDPVEIKEEEMTTPALIVDVDGLQDEEVEETDEHEEAA